MGFRLSVGYHDDEEHDHHDYGDGRDEGHGVVLRLVGRGVRRRIRPGGVGALRLGGGVTSVTGSPSTGFPMTFPLMELTVPWFSRPMATAAPSATLTVMYYGT